MHVGMLFLATNLLDGDQAAAVVEFFHEDSESAFILNELAMPWLHHPHDFHWYIKRIATGDDNMTCAFMSVDDPEESFEPRLCECPIRRMVHRASHGCQCAIDWTNGASADEA